MEISIIGSGTMATGITQVLCVSNEVSKVNLIARTEEKALASKNTCVKNIIFSSYFLNQRIRGAQLTARPYSDYIISQLDLEVATDTNIKGTWIAIGHLITTTEGCQIEALNTSPLISQIAHGQCCLP